MTSRKKLLVNSSFMSPLLVIRPEATAWSGAPESKSESTSSAYEWSTNGTVHLGCSTCNKGFDGRVQEHTVQVLEGRDCNPGLEFSIPGFGIVEFPIPGSRRDWRSIVKTGLKTTKIATWVTVFGSLFLNYKCVRSCYGFCADVL